ncbi:MAG: CTP synthase, partial [Candidatus Micrarchaeia archaeon]
GDYESEIVLEAARQMKNKEGPNNVLFAHIALVPTIITGEMKTKPLQHSVRQLLARGIMPDIIIARSDKPLPKELKEKIALFCNVDTTAVFSSPNVPSIYELPLVLKEQGLDETVGAKLALKFSSRDLKEHAKLVENLKQVQSSKTRLKIAVVGKYAAMDDAYASVFEALMHAGAANNVAVDTTMVDSEKLEKTKPSSLDEFDALVVPGGFGSRGINGKINAVQYARENNKPLLGLCYGLQLQVIEFARNVLKLKRADSTEINPKTPCPVIYIMPEKEKEKDLGGTLRLGVKKTLLEKNTKAIELYKSNEILKRHRHRFEVNPRYITQLEKKGLVFSGKSEDKKRMEILELPTHTFFMGTQYHPEFDSRLGKPEPLFDALVKAAIKNKN